MGETMATLRKTVVTADIPIAVPIGTPLKDRFGLGMMPSLSVAAPIKPWILLGLRLRCGFLSNGSAPSDPGLKDPGMGGLSALFVSARVHPLGTEGQSPATGFWLEIGVGPGLTGSLVRAVGEAGLGWNYHVAGLSLGPTARYVHVVQPADSLDSHDAKILLFGVEIAIREPQTGNGPDQSASATAEPGKVQDRDGDGIPDNVDKCPNEPEDKDGFEDEDGCPDPDNDQDGIPDDKDACPNEPETVNGVKDDDGCPDEAPIVVKKGRIHLKERLLFETNRARVTADGRPALQAVLNIWNQHPEWDHLIVDGHSDRHGPDGFNLWLSHVRAERVRNKLIEMGFPEEKLTLRAFGRRQPRVPEQTEEADGENRRVEFVIVKKGQVPAEPAPEETSSSEPAIEASAAEKDQSKASVEPTENTETAPASPESLEPPAQATAPDQPPAPDSENDEAAQ